MNYRESMAVRVLKLYENSIEHKVIVHCINVLFPALDEKIAEMESKHGRWCSCDVCTKDFRLRNPLNSWMAVDSKGNPV